MTKLQTKLVAVTILGCSGLIALLGSRVAALRENLERAQSQLHGAQPGAFVSDVKGYSTAGDHVEFGSPLPGHKEVLVVYNTVCKHCAASIPSWRQIAGAVANSNSVSILGVSTDDMKKTREYAHTHQLPFQSMALSDPRLVSLNRFTAVPQLLLIEEGGRITHSWLGRIDRNARLDSILLAVRKGNN